MVKTRTHKVEEVKEAKVVQIGPIDRFLVILNFGENPPKDERVEQLTRAISEFLDNWLKSPAKFGVIATSEADITIEKMEVLTPQSARQAGIVVPGQDGVPKDFLR